MSKLCFHSFLCTGLLLGLSTSLSGCPMMLLPTDFQELNGSKEHGLPVNTTDIPILRPGRGSLEESEDMRFLTPEFSLQFAADSPSLIQGIQLRREDLPENMRLGDLVLERWQPDTSQWLPEGFPLEWDTTSSTVYFEIQNPDYGKNFQVQQLSRAQRFRVRVYIFSNQISVQSKNSAFRIHYYPARLGYRDSIISSPAWVGSGRANDPGIPDFVEDVDFALQEVYERLLKLKNSSGQAVFKRPAEPIDVYIRNLGGDDGNAPLGGPISISNNSIPNWSELRTAAAHELVHVLQNQYYAGKRVWVRRMNRWFIEATAQYYAAQALELSKNESTPFYGNMLNTYLGVPLTSSSEGSFYAVGHFLDWASTHISDTLVADTLASSELNNAVALDAQIRAHSNYTGLAEALLDYVSWVNSNPLQEGMLNAEIKSKLLRYHIAQGTWPQRNRVFTEQQTYYALQTHIPDLAFIYGDFHARNNDSAMLVIDASDTPSGNDLSSRTFDHLHGYVPFGKSSSPLESAFDIFDKKYLTIRNVGDKSEHRGVEQWILNRSMTHTHPVKIHYYLLRPPEVTEQLDGKVSWSTEAVQQIPSELLKGYSVYLNNQLLQENLPIVKGKNSQSYEDPKIQAQGLPVRIVITDRHGNQWPELATTEAINFELIQSPFKHIYSATMKPGTSVTLEYRVTAPGSKFIPKMRWGLSRPASALDVELDVEVIGDRYRVTITAGKSVSGGIVLWCQLENGENLMSQSITFIS